MYENKRDHDYQAAVEALKPVLHNLPGKIVAISGLPGIGKTTLARYLAYRFNVSLIETDLFLIRGKGKFIYRSKCIDYLIHSRIAANYPRPVFIEGAVVLRVLEQLKRSPDFIIHVSVDELADNGPLTAELELYEAEFTPASVANLNLKLPKLIDEVP